jgi:MoaA/NifB/PqqE/SkfB family radical SAM enzyme
MIGLNNIKKMQIAWDIAGKLAKLYPKDNFKKIPKDIIIELTNACNLRCPVCPTHTSMKRKKGFMDFNLFKSIMDELKRLGAESRISMNFAGEPLLHPEIVSFVNYAAKSGQRTFISTNATVLTSNLSEQLISAGLKKIHLCIDGLSKESHESYRVGSDFEKVKQNIENFMSVKKRLNSKDPFCSIQTLLTSFSEKETRLVTAWANSIGANSLNLKSLHMGEFTSEETRSKYGFLLPAKKEFRRKISNINKTVCRTPLFQTVVYWNGDLGLCCIDYENSIKIGNVFKNGFIKTLFSDNVSKQRKKGFLKKYSLCRNCPLSDADSMGIDINFEMKTINNIHF